MWPYHRVMNLKNADGMVKKVDPDQTAPLAVWSRSTRSDCSSRSNLVWGYTIYPYLSVRLFIIPVFPLTCRNKRTTGPVSLTWVLRIIRKCWIRTNLEIQEHSMLYNLSSIQKHQEQIWPCHKNGQGHGWYKFWQHLKAFIIPIIMYQFQKDSFCLIIILYGILHRQQ